MKNILLFLTDQWRWDTLFQKDHPCQTPNLDAFAAESTVFSNAYTCCPLCTPARGSLMTGLWPHQNRLMDNVEGGSYYPEGELHRSRVSYLERLRDDAGYATAYSGKCHLGRNFLQDRGIDHIARIPWNDRPALQNGAHPDYFGVFEKDKPPLEQLRVQLGLEQVRELAKDDKPFCAVIGTHGPHFPHHVPEKYVALYEDVPSDVMPDNFSEPFKELNKPVMQSRPYWPCQDTRGVSQPEWRKTLQHYWAYCTWLDALFGEVLAELDTLGLRDNTVVAFTADHGEMLGAHGNFDKGPYFYEEIMHIPMIVRTGGRANTAHQDIRPPANHYVSLRDLFPTLIEQAGAGQVLRDDECARSFYRTDNAHVFYTYDAYQGREFKLRGVHTERYKYNWSPNDLCELYDLQTDPGEQTNLVDDPEYAHIQNELHTLLMNWMESEQDYLLHARHFLPPGAYIDGRPVEAQHVPNPDYTWRYVPD